MKMSDDPEWNDGIVTQVAPLCVKHKNWLSGYLWDEVQFPQNFQEGDTIRVTQPFKARGMYAKVDLEAGDELMIEKVSESNGFKIKRNANPLKFACWITPRYYEYVEKVNVEEEKRKNEIFEALGFKVGDTVQMKEHYHNEWFCGEVTSMNPMTIQRYGYEIPTGWSEVRHPQEALKKVQQSANKAPASAPDAKVNDLATNVYEQTLNAAEIPARITSSAMTKNEILKKIIASKKRSRRISHIRGWTSYFTGKSV